MEARACSTNGSGGVYMESCDKENQGVYMTIGRESVGLFSVTACRYLWRAFVRTVMNVKGCITFIN
jgi:hypothetical protein